MTLLEAREGEDHIIKSVVTGDGEMDAFLLSLGCYTGGSISLVARQKSACVVAIKDGRYTFDNQLAAAIHI